jgi:hypothetical protein
VFILQGRERPGSSSASSTGTGGGWLLVVYGFVCFARCCTLLASCTWRPDCMLPAASACPGNRRRIGSAGGQAHREGQRRSGGPTEHSQLMSIRLGGDSLGDSGGHMAVTSLGGEVTEVEPSKSGARERSISPGTGSRLHSAPSVVFSPMGSLGRVQHFFLCGQGGVSHLVAPPGCSLCLTASMLTRWVSLGVIGCLCVCMVCVCDAHSGRSWWKHVSAIRAGRPRARGTAMHH